MGKVMREGKEGAMEGTNKMKKILKSLADQRKLSMRASETSGGELSVLHTT